MSLAINTCLAANNISQEEYEAIMNTTSSEEYEDDDENEDVIERKYKCFVNCLFGEMNLMNSSGYIDLELVETHQEFSDKTRVAFLECNEQNDHITDKCEYAFSFLLCLKDSLDWSEFTRDSE